MTKKVDAIRLIKRQIREGLSPHEVITKLNCMGYDLYEVMSLLKQLYADLSGFDVEKLLQEHPVWIAHADTLRERIKEGMEPKEVIAELHDIGYSIVFSIKFLYYEYHMSLIMAKELVEDHPCWAREVENANKMRDKLIEILTKKSLDTEKF